MRGRYDGSVVAKWDERLKNSPRASIEFAMRNRPRFSRIGNARRFLCTTFSGQNGGVSTGNLKPRSLPKGSIGGNRTRRPEEKENRSLISKPSSRMVFVRKPLALSPQPEKTTVIAGYPAATSIPRTKRLDRSCVRNEMLSARKVPVQRILSGG